MTPYEAVFGRKASFGLHNFSVPSEFWDNIQTEGELFDFISAVSAKYYMLKYNILDIEFGIGSLVGAPFNECYMHHICIGQQFFNIMSS